MYGKSVQKYPNITNNHAVGAAKRRPQACRRQACCYICAVGGFLNNIALPAE